MHPGDENLVTGQNFRDSAFAIPAALWVNYQGSIVNAMQTDHLKRTAQRYCSKNMDGDHRVGRPHGAFKAKDPPVRRQFVHQEKHMGGNNFYASTQRGAQACYVLFNEKFHPTQGDFELIQPRAGRVDAQGNFTPHSPGWFPELSPAPGRYHGFGGGATPVPRGLISKGRSNNNRRGGFGTIGVGAAFGNHDEFGINMDEDDYMDAPISGFASLPPLTPVQSFPERTKLNVRETSSYDAT